jgi:hypothetical protein
MKSTSTSNQSLVLFQTQSESQKMKLLPHHLNSSQAPVQEDCYMLLNIVGADVQKMFAKCSLHNQTEGNQQSGNPKILESVESSLQQLLFLMAHSML